MKIQYIEWNPGAATRQVLEQAEEIIEEYENDGYTLTLRQLYYQFVAKGLIENSERSYKSLGDKITKGRMAGLISWDAIEDRNRSHHRYYFEEDPMGPIELLPQGIEFDRWARQDHYVEVWVEKEALGNVISRACEPLYVPYMACKGYLSASEAWRAGRRFRQEVYYGKRCVLIHLGDHDPSGIDMTRDNKNRVDLFSELPGDVEVVRLALNRDQIEEYNPPPNPAKVSDSRYRMYMEQYGPISWELDALRPQVLEELIIGEVNKYLDPIMWDEVTEEEERVQRLLGNVARRWDEILPIVEREDDID